MEFLRFSADLYDVKRDTFFKKAQKLLQQFALWDWADELIEAYSHGMKQKLSIISALIHDPKLLVLDEPFVGLDPQAALILKNIMHELCSKGSSIFFSTHVLDVAERLCSKIAIIKDGRLIASGKTEELTKGSTLEEVFMEVIKHD
jgi:ABC-2 type transport system ATP-binding protein